MSKSAQKLAKEFNFLNLPKKDCKNPILKTICGNYTIVNNDKYYIPQGFDSVKSLVSLSSGLPLTTDMLEENRIVLRSGGVQKLKAFLTMVLGKQVVDNFYNHCLIKDHQKNVTFGISCKYKDIMRMSLTKHYISCRNIKTGARKNDVQGLIDHPNCGIAYVRDKRGDFIWRTVFFLSELNSFVFSVFDTTPTKIKHPVLVMNVKSYGDNFYTNLFFNSEFPNFHIAGIGLNDRFKKTCDVSCPGSGSVDYESVFAVRGVTKTFLRINIP